VQTPDPDPNENILTCEDNSLSCSADKSNINSFTFSLPGKYIFKCVVTAGDGVTKALDSRPVDVYPVEVATPNLSIVVSPSNSVSVGTALNFKVGSPKAGFTYSWDFGNGQGLNGENVNFTYNSAGQFTVYLTATTTVNGQTYNFRSQAIMIYVSPTGVPLPGMSIFAPYCGVINTSIPFKVGGPDTTNYNYSFNFTDGPPVSLPAGTDTVNHTFRGLGSYKVILSSTLKNPPNTLNQNTHTIAIANTCL
jgi:PKD repeat protein